jgi:hypothetical protein
VSEEEKETQEGNMTWPQAVVHIVLILAIVAIIFLTCGNDIMKEWLT